MHMATLGLVFLMMLIQMPLVAQGLTPAELIERYSVNADHLISYRILCESSQEFHMDADPNKIDMGYRRSDIRKDDTRAFWRWHQWGGVVGTSRFAPEEEATYHSILWDGRTFSNYRAPEKMQEGVVVFDEDPRRREVDSLRYLNVASPLFGYYPNSFDRVDRMLREAQDISLRERTESIGGSDCFVIDAVTQHGTYTVWIDPEHGFNVARVEIHADRYKGHLYLGNSIQSRHWSFVLLIHEFQKAGEAWAPVEATQKEVNTLPGMGGYSSTTHVQVTDLSANPDHDSLGSFVRDDIGDGTWGWHVPFDQVKCVWQQGDFVPKFDQDTVTQIEQMAAAILDERQRGRIAPSDGDQTGIPDASVDGIEAPLQNEAESPHARRDGLATEPARTAPPSNELTQTAKTRRKTPYPHCGLYCVYAMAHLLGRQVDFRDLVQPEYLGSHEGSSLLELRKGILDVGLHAEPSARLTKRALQACPYAAILHVRSHLESPKYDHYELFLGTEKGKAKLFNPPEAPRLVSFADLATQWDGKALFISDKPIDADLILAADRQRLLRYGMIGVVVILLMHFGRRLWLAAAPAISRRWALGLTVAEVAMLGLAALLCGGAYHFFLDEGLLANASATQALQKGHAMNFVPKVQEKKVQKLLGSDAIFIDARLASDYERGHLAGAISLPVDANDAVWEAALAKIPAGRPIVTYCQSAGCKFAENVSLRLIEEGYSDIALFKGGWAEWVAKHGRPEPRTQPGKEVETDDADQDDPA